MSQLLYEGKGKKVFKIDKDTVRMEFKDSLTAYNARKRGSFKNKGHINRETASLIFRYLNSFKIKNHWIKDEETHSMVVQKINMIPLEVVVRNRLAGSTAKKFLRKEGEKLQNPLFELYYKDDSIEDPFISSEQAFFLGIFSSSKEEIEIKEKAFKINQLLLDLFSQAHMDLIDFKIEFGRNSEQELILGDEISADSCRIWEKETNKRLDKDRFRLDLGEVEESYKIILKKLSESIKLNSMRP